MIQNNANNMLLLISYYSIKKAYDLADNKTTERTSSWTPKVKQIVVPRAIFKEEASMGVFIMNK